MPSATSRRAALAAGLAASLAAAPARAWDALGHDLIEAQAYRRMLAPGATFDDGVGGTLRGDAVLASLIADGVLAPPECFGAAARSASCRAARAEAPARWWPPLRSGRMDFVLDRHFGAAGQCYHFLAHPSDDDAPQPTDPSTGVPAGLVARPYRRCARLLGTRVEVAAGARAGTARGIDNDVYALLHALADAWSPAHVERDARGHIRWLRVWNALPWTPSGDPRARHRFRDPRDAAFVRADLRGDPRCDLDRVHPYAMSPDCLSAPAAEAASTLVDALALIDRMRRRARRGAAQPDLGAAVNRDEWEAFVARHLRHARVPVDGAGTQPFSLDAWPRAAIGLGVDLDGPTPRPGAHVAVMAPLLMLGRDRLLPFVPNASLELGALPREGYRASADVTFSLPFAPWLWVGLAPARVTVTVDPRFQRADVAVGFLAPRVDLFAFGRSHRGLWVRVAGPGALDLVSARWQWSAGVTVGAHLDAALDVQPDRAPRAPRSRPRDDGDRDAIRTWSPPPVDGARVARWPAQTYLYAGFGMRTGGAVVAGVSALRSLPGALHAVDLGGALDVAAPGGPHDLAAELSLLARARLLPFVSVDLAALGVGVERADGPRLTLTARLGASLLLGPLRVSAELPPLDLRSASVDAARGVDLRFLVDLTDVFELRGADVSQSASGQRGGLPTP